MIKTYILTWTLNDISALSNPKFKARITTTLQHETLFRMCQDGDGKAQLHINDEIWGYFDSVEIFENFESAYSLVLQLKKMDSQIFESREDAISHIYAAIDQRRELDKRLDR